MGTMTLPWLLWLSITTTPQAERVAASGSFSMPVIFVENIGQWQSPVRFVARCPDANVAFLRGGLALQRAVRDGDRVKAVVVSFRFEPSGSAEPCAEGESGGRSDFLLGVDRERWRTGARSFSSIAYRDAAAGIDVRFRQGQDRGALEYDLDLAPACDISGLVIACEGDAGLEIGADGTLLIHTTLGPIRQQAPKTWRVVEAGRIPIDCRYRLIDDHRFGFVLPQPRYDDPVVIDPGLRWSTFLGGVEHDESAAISVDAAGMITVVGSTLSADFPTTPGAYDGTLTGNTDGFVAQFDPRQTGSAQLRWSTLVGSLGFDQFTSVAVDALGLVTVAGYSDAADFPTTAGAYDRTAHGGNDGVVLRLDPRQAGVNQLVWSTRLGGVSEDFAGLLVNSIDQNGRVTVGGNTYSPDFPTTAGAYSRTHSGSLDAFLVQFDPSQTGSAQLVFSTLFGGSGDDYVSCGVVEGGHVFGTGNTSSIDLPTTGGAASPNFNGGYTDAFMVELSADGTTLVYCTYLGGSADEIGNGIAVQVGTAYLTGTTASADFPVTAGAFDTAFAGNAYDAFVSSIKPAGTGNGDLLYSTFLGGTGIDVGQAVVVDDLLGVTVAGTTTSLHFPVSACAQDPSPNGNQDLFLTRLRTKGLGPADLVTSTYLGGAGVDAMGPGYTLVLDSFGMPVLTAATSSFNYPTTPGCYDATKSGYTDTVISQVALAAATSYGEGWPGTGGAVPTFVARDYPVIGSTLTLALSNTRGSTTQAVILAGITPAALATRMGGTVLLLPLVVVPITLPAGGAQLNASVPSDLCGVSLFLQALEVDPGASVSVSFSRGLCVTIGG